MKFRFSLVFVLFGILTYGCRMAIFRLITSGQMFVGRGASRMLTSQSDLPVLLPYHDCSFHRLWICNLLIVGKRGLL